MKSLPKVKLGKVQIGSNIAQNHSSSPVISGHSLPQIHMKSYEKLAKSEIMSNWR